MSILDGVSRVLQLYAEGQHELSFTDVTARLGLPKSTASRLLSQMAAYGLVDQDHASRRFRLGSRVIEAVRHSVPVTPLDDACREVLTQLSDASGMTAYLSTLNNHETVVLQRLNGTHPVQVLSAPGSRRDAAGTAMGRALLSRLSPGAFAALYASEANRGLAGDDAEQHTETALCTLAERVAHARQSRCAVAINEAMPGIGAVAAAVRHPASGELRGLCLSFVALQHGSDAIERLQALVLDKVGALGRRIGDPFWQDL